MTRSKILFWSCLAGVALACSESGSNPARRPSNGSGAGGGIGLGTGGTGVVIPPTPPVQAEAPPRTCEICEDLPATPILVDGAPANAPSSFGDPSNMTSGALCIAEPADGTLFPWNWLRPRIRWTGSSSVYEVRITTPRQKNALVAYTTKTEFYVPRDVWAGDKDGKSQGLARNNYEEDITVTVRGANANANGGTPVGASVKFRTAAVDASGSMVYWASVKSQNSESPSDGDAAGWLEGFAVGDEGVVETLRVLDVETPMRSYAAQPKPVACIGCHTSTPDGNAVSFTAFWPWGGAIAGITDATRGQLPSVVTASGLAALQQDWLGAWTYSRGLWRDGYRIGVTSYGASALGWPDGDQNKTNRDNLLWVNISAPVPAAVPTQDWEVRQTWTPQATNNALGILPRSGDNRAALMPDLSNDGSTIAYTSSSSSQDGRIADINDTDIYTVPFNDGNGGPATPLAGAATKGNAEYYPNYAADDAFVAFNRIADVMTLVKSNAQGFENHLYYRPESEIWIAPKDSAMSAAAGEVSAGGAIRLKANDPDTCGGKTSPGVLNSWAKFSPRVSVVNGKAYYWVIFSSTRNTPDSQRAAVMDPKYKPVENLYSRLFMGAFSVEGGKVTTYPAIYLWNQSEDSNNLTPAWDDFNIPDVPVPEVPR